MSLDPFSLARQFIAIPSPTGEEGSYALALEPHLRAAELTVTRQPVEGERFNLLATAGGEPEVVLCTHLDVVPPHIPPREEGDWLFGRGACDTKGILAAMLVAAARLRQEGETRFALLLVVGEEVDSIGARIAARHLDWPCRFIVVGEPTESRFACGQKGALKAEIKVRGKAAHSAYPERGKSALLAMLSILQDLDAASWGEDPVLGRGTLNIGELHAGVRSNIVPGDARAALMVRVVDSVAATEARLREIVAGRGEIDLGHRNEPQTLYVPAGEEGVVVAFNTDIPWLASLGRPLLFGPGSILHAHGPEERIGRQELLSAVDTYGRLVHDLLAGRLYS